MSTYYELFDVKPKAHASEVENGFRRFVARYRPTVTSEQIFSDPGFRNYLNAYLTLKGPLRAKYDELLKQAKSGDEPVRLNPLSQLAPIEQQMLMARIALWRREMAEATHILRAMLERDEKYAPGWALLGETFLSVSRLDDAIDALTHAVDAAPKETSYALRLKQARDAKAGKTVVDIEISPEEEMLREERGRRAVITGAIGLLGLVIWGYAFTLKPALSGLYIPWNLALVLSLGVFIILLALAFGRIIPPL